MALREKVKISAKKSRAQSPKKRKITESGATVIAAEPGDAESQRLEATAKAIHEYQHSPAFTSDLVAAFAAASAEARRENERLGLQCKKKPGNYGLRTTEWRK